MSPSKPVAPKRRRAGGSRAERRLEIRDQLGRAVESLMAEQESYTALSVERLVRRAGISRATFYVYFEDKGDLLRALAEDFMDQLLRAATPWWSLPPTATKADLRAAMVTIVEAYMPHRVVMSAVIEATSYDPTLATQFETLVGRTTAAVAAHIERGQAEGYVTPGIDPERTAAWLTWMAERGLYQLVAAAAPQRYERLIDALSDITWNVLYAPTR